MSTANQGNGLRKIDEAKENDTIPFEMYKRSTTVVVCRETFLNVACDALSEYKYVGPNQRADLALACRYSTVNFNFL